VNSRELIHWSTLHERRARAGWWTSPYVLAIVAGGLIAAWVAWRDQVGLAAGSRAWLAATCVTFAIAFLRVPFHLYWRQDAALLAQLPIEGGPLFDAALLRCLHAAKSTTLTVLIGAVPIALHSAELYARHAAVALALGASAGLFMPAVATWAAIVVAAGQDPTRREKIKQLTGAEAPPPSSALLGALPGFAATFVIVGVLLENRWLLGGDGVLPAPAVLGGIAGVSVLALLGIRASGARMMGTILRDVSALDRQRLATLEIKPPTGLERAIGGLLGEGALAYSKDARLVRRRYPMAFALGALVVIVLGSIGIWPPDDPGPWLTATIAGAAAYAVVLAYRLQRKPIELPRLSASLPISDAARARAKVAWVLGWWAIFVAAPGVFAVVRQDDPIPGFALLGGATVAVIASAIWQARSK
jgi:hypothetical protein